MIDDQTRVDAYTYARCLTLGAEASGVLEVRKLTLSRNHRDKWEARRYTLDQQVKIGSFAHILQRGGRRLVYTTTRGSVQVRTLERWSPRWPIELITGADKHDLVETLELSLLDALDNADDDRRTRRCTMRGFDGDAALDRWNQIDTFKEIAAGRRPLTVDDDVHAYLDWWDTQVPREEQRKLRGLRVSERIFDVASRAGLAEHFSLTVESRGSDITDVSIQRDIDVATTTKRIDER